MWLINNVRRVNKHSLCIFRADPEWGAAHIIKAAYHLERPLAWLELNPQDDELSIGYKLAEALERALEHSFLDYGLAYNQGLNFLSENAATVGPLTLAVSGAQFQPTFVADSLELVNSTYSLILNYSEGEAATPELPDALYLTQEDLMLTLEDARALVGEAKASEEDVRRLLLRSRGAYEYLLASEALESTRPKPADLWLEPKRLVSSKSELANLLAEKAFTDALKLAVTRYPEQTANVLRTSRDYFFLRGLYTLLWETLYSLEPKYKEDETILFYLLSAARRAGKTDIIKYEVEAFLEANEAPNLRALYSWLINDAEQRLEYAREAYTLKATSFTALTYGCELTYRDGVKGEAILRESLTEAERQGNTYEMLRAIWALSIQLTYLGKFRESAYCSKWGLSTYHEHGVNDTRLWLLLANECVYSSLLAGNTKELGPVLAELEIRASSSALTITNIIHNTLGDYYLSQKEPQRALEYYQVSNKRETRKFLGRRTLNVVQALQQLGDVDKALTLAEQAYILSKDTEGTAGGALALGVALSGSKPAEAIPYLQEAFKHYKERQKAPHFIQASLHLSEALQLTGNTEESQRVLTASQEIRAELSETGLWLLGCQAFLEKLEPPSQQTELELSLLGTPKAFLDARVLTLSRRQLEVVALLSLYPEGLSSAELALYLYGDKPKSIKSLLSRLREAIPMEAQPYRLDVRLASDLAAVRSAIQKNALTEAVKLYQGELLPFSNSPRIIAERELIRDEIAQAVLASGDTEALFELCQIQKDNLELWEKLLDALPPEDSRYPSSAAQVRQIKRDWQIEY